MSSRLLTVFAPAGFGQVRPGTELGPLIINTLQRERVELKEGDVVVLASSVVSKAHGLIETPATRTDFEGLVLAHSTHVVAERGFSTPSGPATVQIVRTHNGVVQAAAGLDRSNADGKVLVQPADPDRAAQLIQRHLEQHYGVRLAVILSDSAARPWRLGISDFALGMSGMSGLDDQRGIPDEHGRAQRITVRAIADEIAASADLVKGSARGLPFAVVRGAGEHVDGARTGARALNRSVHDDWFRYGHVEAIHRALGTPAGTTPAPFADGEDDVLTRVTRVLAVIRAGAARVPGTAAWRLRVAGSGARIILSPADTPAHAQTGGHPLIEATAGLGALIERAYSALFAEDLSAQTEWQWAADGRPLGAELHVSLDVGQRRAGKDQAH